MKHMKKCRTCWFGLVRDRKALEDWLLEMLGAEFRYRWEDRGQDLPPSHPGVYRAWLEEGPCRRCPCRLRCDEVCSLRAAWWDARMALLRRKLRMES